MPVAEIFRSLAGNWKINRTISDAREFVDYKIKGTACFKTSIPNVKINNAYNYSEQGEYITDKTILSASCRYIYSYHDNIISVYFTDKNTYNISTLFHNLIFKQEKQMTNALAKAEHICGSDLYRSVYEFYSYDFFKITHKVIGKNKNYTSSTLYRKLSENTQNEANFL